MEEMEINILDICKNLETKYTDNEAKSSSQVSMHASTRRRLYDTYKNGMHTHVYNNIMVCAHLYNVHVCARDSYA